jgi:hypothetical protein
MTKAEFYAGKSIARLEWWLNSCDLPERLVWARLRVFDDGTADACWEEGGRLYGFDAREYAGYFLSEDEYTCFNTMDDADARDWGIRRAVITLPSWHDRLDQSFKYYGTY